MPLTCCLIRATTSQSPTWSVFLIITQEVGHEKRREFHRNIIQVAPDPSGPHLGCVKPYGLEFKAIQNAATAGNLTRCNRRGVRVLH